MTKSKNSQLPYEQRLVNRGRLKNGATGGDPSTAPRCGAKTRSGSACQCPAIRGKGRCKLHGGRSTGPPTTEGRDRISRANWKHGLYTKAHREHARDRREAFRDIRQRRRALIDWIHELAYTNPNVLERAGMSVKAARGLKRKRRS
jgi:hypothetical protein